MKNEKEIILEREDDALAETTKLDNPLSLRGAHGHIDRAEEEWAREPNLFERLVRDAGTKMLDVERDVRIFGQERASYLGVPMRQSPSSLAGTNGDIRHPALAESGQPAAGPIYPRDAWERACGLRHRLIRSRSLCQSRAMITLPVNSSTLLRRTSTAVPFLSGSGLRSSSGIRS